MRQYKKSVLIHSLNLALLTLSAITIFSCSGQKRIADSEPETVQQNSAAASVQDGSYKEAVKSEPRAETRTKL